MLTIPHSPNYYQGKRVLITGHSGFKGSWLSLVLKKMGAELFGLSDTSILQPFLGGSLTELIPSKQIDLSISAAAIKESIDEFRPDLIFHLAGQASLSSSYGRPHETMRSNTVGGINLLHAFHESACRNMVFITSDKVYQNPQSHALKESEALGANDPYSASKAAIDLIAQSYQALLFPTKRIGIARAGNVIGGGDFSEGRLIPDLVSAYKNNSALKIRMATAVRPWQFVLDAIHGYLLLGAQLQTKASGPDSNFNFGPSKDSFFSVNELLEIAQTKWPSLRIDYSQSEPIAEANFLYLDSSKAKQELNWSCKYTTEEALEHSLSWYEKHHANSTDMLAFSEAQIENYWNKTSL